MGAPDLPTLLWRDWQPAWGLDALAIGWAVLYLLAARRVRAGWPRRRTTAFLSGVAGVLVALQSGIGALDDQLLSDHMVQHLLLLELAPLLLLAGRPGMLILRAAPPSRRPGLARLFLRLRPVTNPLVCLGVFFVVVFVSHLSFFYDATLREPAVHDAEHLLYLGAGLMLWWPVLDADPVPRHRLNGVARLGYVIAAMLPMTLIGAYMDRNPAVIYVPYAGAARVLGISALRDQQQAGAIMWVVGSMIMVLAGLWQAMAAMNAEERRLQRAERTGVKAAIVKPRADA